MAKPSGSRLFDAFRGALIGAAEALPGISGGTVALIVGVFERLIAAAGHLSSAVRMLLTDLPGGKGTQRASAEVRQADWAMLIPLMIGMVAGLLLSARLLAPLVNDHQQYAYALFFGLVLASLWIPYTGSGQRWTPANYAVALLFAVAAFLLTSLSVGGTADNKLVVFVSGAIAICALVMPGLSGSFLLLALGMYEPTIDAVNDRDLGYIAVFGLGAVTGLVVIVKVLRWLLEHRHHITLVVLTGVMTGSLRALWPWQGEDEHDRSLYAPEGGIPLTVAMTIIGFATVAMILVAAHRKSNPSRRGKHARVN